MAAPITGRWRTLRIEGSRAQCWLRVLLDGEEIHTGTGPCDPTGGYVMLGSAARRGHPVNGAWSDLRVFRGAPVAQHGRRGPPALGEQPALRQGTGRPPRRRGGTGSPDGSSAGSRATRAIATVDADGAVIAIRKGEVTLTARCEGRTASVALLVTSP